jgi:Flp pilus assembly protein TadG
MRRTERERGTAVAELALVLPILLILGLICSEGAGLLRAHQVLNNAAREGAHLSAMPENNCQAAQSPATCLTAMRQAVVDYATRNSVALTTAGVALNQNVTINFPDGTVAQGSSVVVTFNYQLRFLPRLPFMNSAATSIPLRNAAEFQNFYSN